MAETLRMPMLDGHISDYRMEGHFPYAGSGAAPRTRIPYAAVPVGADALAEVSPSPPAAVDAAQRGMGLDGGAAKELISRSVTEAKAVGGRIVCGAQTDQVASGSARTLRD